MSHRQVAVASIVAFAGISVSSATLAVQSQAILSPGQNGFAADPQRWGVASCSTTRVCELADPNGDGAADLVLFDRDSSTVSVALSIPEESRFTPFTVWARGICGSEVVCRTGDVNGDEADDVVVFYANGEVDTGISDGAASFSLGRFWFFHPRFCLPGELCRVGDVDGNGQADLVAFVRDARREHAGDVYVSLTQDANFGEGRTKWHEDFGHRDQQLELADVNGDGRDDIVDFVHGPLGSAPFWVALSSREEPAFVLQSLEVRDFCRRGWTCRLGDVNGDAFADAIAFIADEGAADPPLDSNGDVLASLARLNVQEILGRPARGVDFTRVPMIRHENFCTGGSRCLVGDVDGDGRDDLVSVPGASPTTRPGPVLVARSEFGRTTHWRLRVDDLMIERQEDDDEDDPYFVILGFRTTLNERGSTEVFVNEFDNDDWATGAVSGSGPHHVPAFMGEIFFRDVSLPTINEVLLTSVGPEVLGAVIIAFDGDATMWPAMDRLVSGLRASLRRQIATLESQNAPSLVLNRDALPSIIRRVEGEIRSATEFSLAEAVEFWVSSFSDPDDLIGFHVLVALALDKEATTVFPLPSGPDRSVGVLGESLLVTGLRQRVFQCRMSACRVDPDIEYRASVGFEFMPFLPLE